LVVAGASEVPYAFLANAVLVLHACIVLFVVGALVLIVVGNLLEWRWVNALWFRVAHLAAILFVAVQSIFGEICPLTTLESWLRHKAGATGYSTGFVQEWVQRLIYYEAPPWVFTLAYTLFALLVLAVWWYFPPSKERTWDSGRTPRT
jgi:hypothetical protein